MSASSKSNGPTYPPLGFYFEVSLDGQSSGEAGFREVSGISASLETKKIAVGGLNTAVYNVPVRRSFENLVLKRGLSASSSSFSSWCRDHLEKSGYRKISPKSIKVHLRDPDKIIMSWSFVNAYPIKWQVTGLDAQKSEIVIESVTIAYSYFSIV